MIRSTTQTAQTHVLHGVSFSSYIRSEVGALELAAWAVTLPPHTPGLAHRMSVEEVFRVLTGRITIEIDDQSAEISADEVIAIPAGSRFRVSNATDHTATAWVVTSLGMTVTMEEDATSMAPPWAQ